MIEPLVRALLGAGVEVEATEIADLMWLAAHMEDVFLPAALAATRTGEGQRDKTVAGPPSARKPPGSSTAPGPVPLVLPPRGDAGSAGRAAEGLAVRVPAAAALPDTLALGRALRPLRRKVPSRTHTVADEGASAERIAETRTPWVVTRPASVRWLDLALLVDSGASMVLWRRTAAELQRFLRLRGVFRDVRTLWMFTDDEVELRTESSRGTAGSRVRPLALVDPAGRRLVVVVSDCVSGAWRAGKAGELLAALGRKGPVALLQLLPESLWPRTALRRAPRAWLRPSSAGVANSRILFEYIQAPSEVPSNEPPPLPVVVLEPESLAAWARLVAGKPGTVLGVVGIPASPARDARQSPSRAGGDGEEQASRAESVDRAQASERLERFLTAASPAAATLVRCLAAVPISLAVMRLVQRAMVPGSGHTALAEVFFSGLLRKVPGQPATVDSEEVQYDLLPGVRDRLLDLLPGGDARRVIRRVSEDMAQRTGRQDDFLAAVLSGEQSASLEGDPEQHQPFARMAMSVLGRLGGSHAELASRLEKEWVTPAGMDDKESSTSSPVGADGASRREPAVDVGAHVPPPEDRRIADEMEPSKPRLDPVRVFYVRAEEDDEFCRELDMRLAPYRRASVLRKRPALLSTSSPQSVPLSEPYEEGIRQLLDRAELAVMFISPNLWISQRYEDVARALELQAQGGLRVVPIIVRAIDLGGHDLSEVAMLPRRGGPLALQANRDAAYLEIAEELVAMARATQARRTAAAAHRSPAYRDAFTEMRRRATLYSGPALGETRDSKGLERVVRATDQFLDVERWNARLGRIQHQVCRIQTPISLGTGFLIGPDLVLTCYHVVEDILSTPGHAEFVSVTFDDMPTVASILVREPRRCLLRVRDWLVDHRRYNSKEATGVVDPENIVPEELDYAVLRLAQSPGNDVVDRPPPADPILRGWLEGSPFLFQPGSPLFIVQYPDGAPMKLALDTDAIIKLSSNGLRVTYRTDTEPGSAGSPCFNSRWELVALHQRGTGTESHGIPIMKVMDELAKKVKLLPPPP